MSRRHSVIANSVTYSILHSDKTPSFFARLPAFFYLHWLTFVCVREDLFTALRGVWEIDLKQYRKSFGGEDSKQNALQAMGDMGFSGSTFFTTTDGAWIVKSIPRHFENSFFKNDLLLPYADYMRENRESLLCRITDFLECVQVSVGVLFGLAPSHHIVMENLLKGKDQAETEWETYDLKPMSYFFPERDIAEGVLTSEATKSKLADEFHEKIVLTLDDAEHFKGQLEKDTALLSQCNAVDYSLFFIRIPIPASPEVSSRTDSSSWRTGVTSGDGKYYYRAAILDFFWATHKVHAKVMTGLVNTYRVLDDHGPMSVTTDAPEYRTRFLKMVSDMIEIRQDG